MARCRRHQQPGGPVHEAGRDNPFVRNDQRARKAELDPQQAQLIEHALTEHDADGHPENTTLARMKRPTDPCLRSRPPSLTTVYAAPDTGLGKILAAVAWTLRHRRFEDRGSSRRVERDEEHPLEGGDPRTWIQLARDLGRQGVRALGGAGRRGRSRHRTRRAAALNLASRTFVDHGARPEDRQGALGAHRARDDAARRGAPAVRHLRLVVRVHRWPARLRVLRLVRALRLRHERQADDTTSALRLALSMLGKK